MKCVLAICGLPASGKTSLVNALISLLKDKSRLNSISTELTGHVLLEDINVISICFDDLIPLDVQQEKVKQPDEWKRIRQDVLAASEMFLMDLEHDKPHNVAEGNHFYELIVSQNNCGNTCGNHLVVVEDNLYYASMRYSWYQIARKWSSGFCQAWLERPLAELLERNAARSCSVPAEVIQTMSLRQELPAPEKNAWEKHSILLDSDCQNNAAILGDLCGLVLKAFQEPLKPPQPPQCYRKEDAVSSSSDVHLVDRILRRIVSCAINEAKVRKCFNLATYSKEVNLRRQVILEQFRSGTLQIPTSLERQTQLEQFVNHIFFTEELQKKMK